MRRRFIGATLPVAILFATGCEMLGPSSPTVDPIVVRLDELDRRLDAIERILASGSLIDLTVQVDELQRQTSALRGRTESLEHSTSSTQDRQRDLYNDLDDRIQFLETSVPGRPVVEPAASDPAPAGTIIVPAGTDRENYEAAFELLKQQQYRQAGDAFQQFLVAFPDSQLADNAQYWLGEAYYVRDEFGAALEHFRKVIIDYPRSRKIPDALLKIGYSNYEMEQWPAARSALEQVRDNYADTTFSRLAEQRLRRMSDEGN